MNLMRLLGLSLFCLSTLALAQESLKDVKIEWETVKKAKSYEIRILSTEKGATFKKTDQSKVPEFSVSLPPGEYSYQIRAIDRFNRAGAWSERAQILVAAPPPPITEPEVFDSPHSYATKKRSGRFSLGLEMGRLSSEFRSTLGKSYEQQAWAPRGTFGYLLTPDHWEVQLSAHGTIARTGYRYSFPTSIRAHYFGWEAKVSYIVPLDLERFSLKLYAGGSHQAFNTDKDALGYSVFGPMLFPELGFRLTSDSTLLLTVKISPLSTGLNINDFNSNEKQLGFLLIVDNPFSETRMGFKLGLSLEFSKLTIMSSVSRTTNDSTFLSLGIWF